MAADDRTRPDWWPRWVPIRCANGHPLLPGGVASHWVNHACPASVSDGDGRGHFVWSCEAVQGCHDEFRPPDCVDNPAQQRK